MKSRFLFVVFALTFVLLMVTTFQNNRAIARLGTAVPEAEARQFLAHGQLVPVDPPGQAANPPCS
jgi:hypothetical protein